MPEKPIKKKCIDAIRILSADSIEKSQSGHPGICMGAAPMSMVLWDKFIKHNPQNPNWLNRDRFILSAGHGSMLLYSLMFLTGYKSVTMDEIKNFRQWSSKTPGHPENTVTPGVEVTTGPLGQGIANAVGMAMAEAHLAARFNKPDISIVDHFTYTLMGDGCMMEGISSEACSLAGHLGLGKLIALYDDNGITIDGKTDVTFTEDVAARFKAYGWQVIEVKDGNNDTDAISSAIEKARQEKNKPSLIKVTTTIGYGADEKADTPKCHGAPLGEKELLNLRKNLNWEYEPFEIPSDVLDHMRSSVTRGQKAESQWMGIIDEYKKKYPDDAKDFESLTSLKLPGGWKESLPDFSFGDAAEATRNISGVLLNAAAKNIPGLLGGSADLAGSNKNRLKCSGEMQKNAYANRNINYGVREHAMAAISNGISLHNSGLIPFCATFLSFADYMRGAIRVGAISNAGVIYIMTHDSLAVGEDGPTHQPVEQLASLRAIHNLNVIRPADGNETKGAYINAISNRKTSSVLVFSRQKLPQLEGSSADMVQKGAYILKDCDTPRIILMASGSEVHLCVEAAKKLTSNGQNVRVVSIPSFELFEAQNKEYKNSVLPSSIKKRLAVEAGSSMGWHRYYGDSGKMICVDKFGSSAPGNVCMEKYGFTVDNIIKKANDL